MEETAWLGTRIPSFAGYMTSVRQFVMNFLQGVLDAKVLRMTFHLTIANRRKFHFALFDKFGTRMARIFGTTILLEYHEDGCTCSYCHEDLSVLGLHFPENKAPNAWRRIHLKVKKGIWFLRATLPYWLCQQTTQEERLAARLMGEKVRKWK